jgi:hypothetical protein
VVSLSFDLFQRGAGGGFGVWGEAKRGSANKHSFLCGQRSCRYLRPHEKMRWDFIEWQERA